MEANEMEKPYSKWEWVLYIVVLPSIFTLLLTGIILTFMKVDVIGAIKEIGNKIPIIEKLIPDIEVTNEEEFQLYENTFVPNKGSKATSQSEELLLYQDELNEKKAYIQSLEADLVSAKAQIADLEQQILQLRDEMLVSADTELQAKISEIAQVYSGMTASKAAPILSKLDKLEAVNILAAMDNRTRSQILAKMDPQLAAEITVLLLDTK